MGVARNGELSTQFIASEFWAGGKPITHDDIADLLYCAECVVKAWGEKRIDAGEDWPLVANLLTAIQAIYGDRDAIAEQPLRPQWLRDAEAAETP